MSQKLKQIHNHSSYHRAAVERSSICGCFYCLKTFPPKIKEWIDGGQTALCPNCGIDSVLPEEYTDADLLKEMSDYWFCRNEIWNDEETD